ncbi:hypothetical protein Scep_005300 [Stephania cephalantha]|uniref:Uncharacterized protein n=1 Tax=Stephania cephalantha TaxID=152367 RepID=A0AAP0PZY3_9MAGN
MELNIGVWKECLCIFHNICKERADIIVMKEYGVKESYFVRRREEHTQAIPDQPTDEKQLYYDAAGDCSKERVYGLGPLAKRKRRYEDPKVPVRPGSRWCGVQSLMQLFKGLHSSSFRAEPVENVHGLRSKHLSSRHHRRHHHLRSIISRLGWIPLVHH